MLESLFKLLAPHTCIGCGREGSVLCDWCQVDAFASLPERCYRCHKLSPDNKVCDTCRRHAPLSHVWIATAYQDYAKELLRLYKFERTKDIAGLLASVLDQSTPYLPDDTIVTYVPTATSRIRQRGYDHAAELAKFFAKRRKLPCMPLLYRLGQTHQVGAKREKRLSQLEKAFRPRNENQIIGRPILIIDDIVTTGASIGSAAKILKAVGAKQINAAIFAQKQSLG